MSGKLRALGAWVEIAPPHAPRDRRDMATENRPGDEVRYHHEGEDYRAQVSEVNAAGEVIGINVYGTERHILFGVTALKLATEPGHRILDGYFWKQKG